MRKIALVYGAILAGVISVITIGPLVAMGFSSEQMEAGEVLGYVSMVLACLSVFFGILSYRNKHLGGNIKFGKAFVTGLCISLVGGLGFGLVSWLYYGVLAPDFLQAYYDYSIEAIEQSGKEAALVKAQIAEMQANKAIYLSPLVGGLTMFATVFPIGAVVALVSALILKKP